MRIDAHQHYWTYNSTEYAWIDDSMSTIRRDYLPADLKPELDRAGFDGSVVVQTRQTFEETRWLLDLAAQNPTILGVVGWTDLRSPNIRSELEVLTRNPKLVGVRHIVQAETDNNFLLRPDFLRGVATLEEFGLAYDILIYTRHLPVAVRFAEQFPQQRFVLDHIAKPPICTGEITVWSDGIRRLAESPNVFCKLSGLVTEADWKNWTPEQIKPYLDVAFDAFGTDRLMIGSDWPVCLLASSYQRVMNVVKEYVSDLPLEQQNAVMGGNAERFWRLHG